MKKKKIDKSKKVFMVKVSNKRKIKKEAKQQKLMPTAFGIGVG